MANGDDDLGFTPAAKPADDLGFVPARKPAQSTPPPGLLQRIGQGIEKWWTTPQDEGQDPYTLAKLGRAPRITESPREGVAKTAKLGMAATAPFAVPAMAASPGATLLGLGGVATGGTVGGAAGRYLGGKVGAPQLGEDVGGLAGGFFGGMAGGAAGSPSARRALARTIIDPATLEPRPIAKALPLLGKERATAIGDILDPNLPKVRNMTAAADASFQNRANELGAIGEQESQLGQENAKAVQRDLQGRKAVPVSGSPGGYAGPQKPVDPVLQAVREGRASKIPTRMPPTVPPPKPLVSLGGERASEPTFTGSEGRAATWTNEDVMRLARQGNREAISQAIRRGMELPAGARYVMGDADPGRAVYNPREVTRFSPEGTPIRNMENPTVPKSSRSRIATPESLQAKPLPFTGPPSSSAAPRPFTIANAMGIRWAKTPGLPDISIPNNMAEEDIPAYVAEKQALQSKGVTSILGNK